MPRIPQLQTGTSPGISQAQASVGAAGPAAFGAGIGQAVEGVGNTLQGVGARLGELALSIQRDTNRTEVTNALLDAEKQLNDRQYGPNGYLSKYGNNAKGSSGLLEKDIYKIRNIGAKGLKNPAQKEMFEQAFARSAEGARMRTLSHEAGQMRVANIASLEGRVLQERQNAFLDPNSQGTIDTSLQRTRAINAEISGLSGESPELAKLRNDMAESDIHASVVDRLLQDQDVTAAQAYFDKNKDSIDEGTRGKLANQLKVNTERQQAATVGQGAYDKFGDDSPEEALAYIRDTLADKPEAIGPALSSYFNTRSLSLNAKAADDSAWRDDQTEGVFKAIKNGDYKRLDEIRNFLQDNTSERGADVTAPLINMIDRAFDAGQTQRTAVQKQQQAEIDIAGDSVLKDWLSQIITNGKMFDAEDPVRDNEGNIRRNPDGSPMVQKNHRQLETSDIIHAGAKLGMSIEAIEGVIKHYESGGFKINSQQLERIMRSHMSDSKLDINDPKYYGLSSAVESVIGLNKNPSDEDYRQALDTLLTPTIDIETNEMTTSLQQIQRDRVNNRFRLATQDETDAIGDRLSLSEAQIVDAQSRLRVFNALLQQEARKVAGDPGYVDTIKSELAQLEDAGEGRSLVADLKRSVLDAVEKSSDVSKLNIQLRETDRDNAVLFLTQELFAGTPLRGNVPGLDRDIETIERTPEQQRRLDLQSATQRLAPVLRQQGFNTLFPPDPNPYVEDFRRAIPQSPLSPADRLREAIDAIEELQVESP